MFEMISMPIFFVHFVHIMFVAVFVFFFLITYEMYKYNSVLIYIMESKVSHREERRGAINTTATFNN